VILTVEQQKARVAQAALEEVRSGMILGLGSGSTMVKFLDVLGAALSRGDLTDIVGVPTSEATAAQCRRLNIPLIALARAGRLDVAIDGADEVAPDLGLIKGLGGALLREKMVAGAAQRFVVIADQRKIVKRLGERSALPVEVVPFAWDWHIGFLTELGARPEARRGADGALMRTDNGNIILDCYFSMGISSPGDIASAMAGRPGVVEHGLFLGMAQRALIVDEAGTVRSLTP